MKSRMRLLVGVAGVGAAAYLGAMVLLSTSAVSYALMDRIEIFPALTQLQIEAAAREPHAAIVILGAGRRVYAPEFGGETVDEFGLERVRYGAALARLTELPVLVSGRLESV